MNRRAFTLVELLAIIVVLGIVLVIAVPKMLNSFDISKEKINKTKEEEIKKGARDYTLYNNTTMPLNIGNRIKIKLTDLTDNNFVSKIYDLDDNSLCVGYVYITKTNTENYEYLPCLFCTNYQTQNANCNISNL